MRVALFSCFELAALLPNCVCWACEGNICTVHNVPGTFVVLTVRGGHGRRRVSELTTVMLQVDIRLCCVGGGGAIWV